ncbi:MAG: glycerophosphodiester phosphodiesterase [Actinomycetota bacterium]
MLIRTGSGEGASRELALISHRGGKGFGPENTLQALQAALDHGVEMVETDVRMTADRVPVIHHSPFIGLHLISRMDADELAEKAPEVPTLEAFLTLAADRCAVNLEVKKCDADVLAATIAGAALAHPILVSSFDAEFLRDFRETASGAELGLLSQYELTAERMLRDAERCGATTLLPASFTVRRNLVEEAHTAGARVIAWTVNSTQLLGEMVAAGVDGIITDAYSEMKSFLEAAPGIREAAEAVAACGADNPA